MKTPGVQQNEVATKLAMAQDLLREVIISTHEFNDANGIPNCRTLEIVSNAGEAVGIIQKAIDEIETYGVWSYD